MSFRNTSGTFLPSGVSAFEKRVLVGLMFLLYSILVTAFLLDKMWLLILPFAVILLLYVVEEIESVLYIVIILVPISQETRVPGTGSALQIPTEPVLLLLLGVWGLQLIVNSQPTILGLRESRRVTRALLFFVGSLLLSAITSSNPLVSFKLLINTSWYLAGCYFFVIRHCRTTDHVVKIVSLFFVSSVLVVIYSLVRHSASGFDGSAANVSVHPFFTEHGSYSGFVAIVLGLSLGLGIGAGRHVILRLFAIVTSVILLVGILFSYTRAAWLGVGVMVLFFLVMRAKELLRFRSFVLLTVVAGAIALVSINIGIKTSIEQQATSITDVERNLSNLERFNRWVAALNMIKAHPILGVGYGTYPIRYEEYKDKRFLTLISNFFGGPHNDYLQYWSEAGIFGIGTWLFFLFSLYSVGVRHYFLIEDEFTRNILLGSLGGTSTYLVHAFFNDFLQYDKVAVPFWMAIALVIVSIELGHAQKQPGVE